MSEDDLNLDDAFDKAAAETTKATAHKAPASARLTKGDLAHLFPEASKRAKVEQLIAIVNRATSENDRINAIAADIQHLGPAILALVKAVC